MVLTVGWSKMSGFEVRWPKPNLAYNWIVKNGLFPLINICHKSIKSDLVFSLVTIFNSLPALHFFQSLMCSSSTSSVLLLFFLRRDSFYLLLTLSIKHSSNICNVTCVAGVVASEWVGLGEHIQLRSIFSSSPLLFLHTGSTCDCTALP
jgi:hypothetical protein